MQPVYPGGHVPLALCLALGVLCVASTRAHAQESELSALNEARVHAERGHRLYAAGRFDLALDAYLRALPLAEPRGRSDALHWNIGRCYEALGQEAAALAEFRALAGSGSSPAIRQRARERSAEISARSPGRIRVTCAETEGVRLHLLGEFGDVGAPRTCPTTWERVSPGLRRVVAQVDGQPVRSFEVQLSPGAEARVVFDLPEPLSAGPVGSASPAVSHTTSVVAKPAPWKWVAAGAVVATFTGATAALLASRSEGDAADAAWRRYDAASTPEEARHERSATRAHETRARELQTGAWIAYGVGSVGLGLTAFLFVDRAPPVSVVAEARSITVGWGGAF